MVMEAVDIVIIGGGPGGYASAIRAAQLGAKVKLIEEKELGGVCLNRGCVPIKALLQSVSLLYEVNKAQEFGILVDRASADFSLMMEKAEKIVKRLTAGLNYLMKANKIETIRGRGRIASPRIVEVSRDNVDKIRIESKNIIIATGSVPNKASLPGVDERMVLTTDDVLGLREVPKSLLIFGDHPVGAEFAFIFNILGAKVTLIASLPLLLPDYDGEIAIQFQRVMKKEGIDIIANVRLDKVSGKGEDKMVLVDAKGEEREMQAERVLLTDRVPNITDLGLGNADVAVKDGRILVNDRMETSVPGIYAVGDITGGLYAHTALREGITAAENARGIKSRVNYKTIPKCLFTVPEVASVGLTEEQAEAQNYSFRIGRFPFVASGSALTQRETRGFVKIISEEETGEILGVHIIGPGATHLIAEAALAINLEATTEELISTLHMHPTLSEALTEAALDAEGRPIHKA